MSSGWVGPGAKTSPQNQSELEDYKRLKRHLEAQEREKERERGFADPGVFSGFPFFFFFLNIYMFFCGVWGEEERRGEESRKGQVLMRGGYIGKEKLGRRARRLFKRMMM